VIFCAGRDQHLQRWSSRFFLVTPFEIVDRSGLAGLVHYTPNAKVQVGWSASHGCL